MIVIIMFFSAALFGLGWVASGRAIRPASQAVQWRLTDYPALVPEPITFRSATGITLAGRFFRGSSRAAILLSHGYGGIQDEMLPIANTLHNAGFSVFTYDLRGCGHSGGLITFGALEQQDLISAVDYLMSRDDVEGEKIGALGFSMGAAVTVLAAAQDTRIRAVLDDSGWSDIYHWLRPSVRTLIRHPTAPFSALSLKIVEARLGIRLSSLRPVDTISKISPRHLCVIHGTCDSVVPPNDSRHNFAAAGEPKEVHWLHGGAHGDTMQPENAAYAGWVTEFFRDSLRP